MPADPPEFCLAESPADYVGSPYPEFELRLPRLAQYCLFPLHNPSRLLAVETPLDLFPVLAQLSGLQPSCGPACADCVSAGSRSQSSNVLG